LPELRTEYQQLQLLDTWRGRQNARHGIWPRHSDLAGLHAQSLDDDL
jgi:hypothetical protein